ncbi:Hpt domain-containing protein [Loktanella sp. TSTF-M6]|uniref:Hpt domain-containing protein n=1 Tax=Loktanella gaetbuli TaxID=2881335 RepID=A0ABS8BYH0_9RHOB|nr:Hpt domain-containing protein [Loktanella gaetbuli]MCB5200787.1 Hpt domain-containing protein [Loktanella gaetbuli]
MTQTTVNPVYMGRMQQRFIQNYYARHDALEVLFEAKAYRDALAILSDVHGSAEALGLTALGQAAALVRDFLTTELNTAEPSDRLMHTALNAYLDVSMEFCNPTERFLATA